MGDLIESSNFIWMLVSFWGAYHTYQWRTKGMLSEKTDEVVRAWAWVFMASGINHGWFAISRFTSSDGLRWNPAMYEYRWLLIVGTLAMFCWGMVRFFGSIEEISGGRRAAILGIIAIVGFAAGYL